MLLTIDDFVNKWELSTGMYDQAKLTSYIAKYEERYLLHLLGGDLYKSFESDLTSTTPQVPQSPNFLKIFNPFYMDWNRSLFLSGASLYGYRLNQILESDGMLDMLKGFIYWEYARDLMNQQTPYGNVKQRAENSVVVDSPHSLMWERYNEAIRTYRTIQEYINGHFNQVLGQIVSFDLTTAGTGYVDGTFDLTGGSGSGATALIKASGGMGHVNSLTLPNVGSGYVVGNVLTINSGDLNATITLTYVGVGDFSLFNGMPKSTSYWI